MNEAKLKNSVAMMTAAANPDNVPVIMSSFGKDSMAVLYLAKMLRLKMPVIYHRQNWFPEKNRFADTITADWGLEVYDWPPAICGTKTKADVIEPVFFYQYTEKTGVKIPVNTINSDGRMLCGLTEVIGRPKGTFTAPWRTLIFGQKSSDVDQFEGHCILKGDFVPSDPATGGPSLLYPIRDWTDDDVWDFIEEHNIPFQRTRYAGRRQLADKRYNNDYIPCCMKCLDRREPERVFCPKLGIEIDNQSGRVPDLEQQFDYIEYR